MAVGANSFPVMPVVEGCRLSSTEAGIRYQGRHDLALISLCEGSVVAGCFTQNAYQAAPVTVAKAHLQAADSRYFLINSGNANACTGEIGEADALKTCVEVAALTGVSSDQVLPFSTGVIGEPMNMPALLGALPQIALNLESAHWEQCARAIMTTDTFPKGVSRQIEIDGVVISINGIAKGSGMIRPDMATMLAYIVTDATIDRSLLQTLCQSATDKSFNRITVDGDTSTNDACMLAATGAAGTELINSFETESGRKFAQAVTEVFEELAKLLVRDGEGATKFVTIDVMGGVSSSDCLKVAYSIGESPLVKTALFASDPNWGRLVMAIGRSGVRGLDPNKVRVWLDDTVIVEFGSVAESYEEALGQKVLNQEEFSIRVDLGMGESKETIWTCDFSHEYVSINADYRS